MNLLSPPLAFLAYVVLVSLLILLGRVLAGQQAAPVARRSVYASGEGFRSARGGPGYALFFGGALFFAVLHVGVLIAASGAVTPVGVAFVAGLLLILVVVGVS